MLNQPSVTECLLGVTDIQELQPLLLVVILTIYIGSVAGNGSILMIVISDSKLHFPLYSLLGNLSCLYICYSMVTLLKMLENLVTSHKAISFLGCISQLYFFHFVGSTEALLLGVMALDCFVTICKPLHYTVIIHHLLCIQMTSTVCVIGFFHALLHSIMTCFLNICGSNHIHHFFCNIKPLLELTYGNVDLNQWLLNSIRGIIATSPFFLILLSYFYILTQFFFKTHSCRMFHKALSTCASHFMIVILFYVSVLFTYIRPASGSPMEQDAVIAIMYSVVTPVLNPLVYTLRNRR